jgi:hypothetical protein
LLLAGHNERRYAEPGAEKDNICFYFRKETVVSKKRNVSLCFKYHLVFFIIAMKNLFIFSIFLLVVQNCLLAQNVNNKTLWGEIELGYGFSLSDQSKSYNLSYNNFSGRMYMASIRAKAGYYITPQFSLGLGIGFGILEMDERIIILLFFIFAVLSCSEYENSHDSPLSHHTVLVYMAADNNLLVYLDVPELFKYVL